MNHWEMENTVTLGVALKDAGFEVSQICCSRPSCFDFAGKKDNKTVLVKVSSDVDSLSTNHSRELKVISSHLFAAPLIVSQQSHGKPLEDDTVYSRNEVFVVTKKTIQTIALQTVNPIIYAGPGGYSVQIDGLLIEKRRKEMGLSIGKLAGLIGVSRRTLYGYERGMTKASVKSAYKLAETLGIPVAKPINVTDRMLGTRQCLRLKAKWATKKKNLLQNIFKKFVNNSFSPVHLAPFDFIMEVSKEKDVILGSIATNDERDLERRMEEVESVSRIVSAHPVLITEEPLASNGETPCFCMDDIAAMQEPEELIAAF